MRCRPRICALAFAIVVAASAPAFADPNRLKVESLVVSPVSVQRQSVAANFNIDYTVCNVDTNALYRPTLSPSGPRPGLAGNPPEDFVPQAFSNNGGSLTPSCPGGLTHSAGVKLAVNPGPPNGIIGGRPACGGSLTYRLRVEASRGGEQKSAEATFSVTPVSPLPCPN